MDEEHKEEVREEKNIQERKEKIGEFFKKPTFWIVVFFIIALVLGAYIRTLPMQNHSLKDSNGQVTVPTIFQFISGQSWASCAADSTNKAGLCDVATNDWTLGPDLDPWLFTRYAKTMIENGSLPKIDKMRYPPLGFNPHDELQMVAYMIVVTYKLTNIFAIHDVNFAAALDPALMFVATIVVFFFFVREIFLVEKEKKTKLKANIIALISTFFMIVIPAFLSRTVAGIPEKEANGFFFMFLAFFLFIKAWRSKGWIETTIFSILGGVATAFMGLTWGGVTYIYVTIALAVFVAFLLNKMGKKESLIYILWIVTALIVTFSLTPRYSLKGFVTGLDTGLVTLMLFFVILNYILWNTKLKDFLGKIKFFNQTKIPKNILSIIIGIVILILSILVILGPGFFAGKISTINNVLFNPVTGRWSTTVAENRQPYFTEWASEFGPTIKNLPNLPIMFWLFFIGSVVLFASILSKLNKKDKWILTGLYVLFFFGLVFSRYAPHPAVFDGEGFLSKGFYLGSAALLALGLLYYYIKYEKEGNKALESIDFGYILLFALFILTLFTARSAVRLIMVLAPVASIFASFLIVDSFDRFRKAKDETWKVVMGAIMVVIILASAFCFYSYYQEIKQQSYSYVPGFYNQQWQYAMKWVRDDTPANAVFAHWWDYGYWVQSIGNRETVLDGGNAISFWNYYMGRLVLTGDNQQDSLNFLYDHNATYLLIDSSDIGKYGAFSSIGSDANYDRYSWVGTFVQDETQTQETKNQSLLVYPGGIALDENIVINGSSGDMLLPGQKTGVGAIIIPENTNGNQTTYGQPYAIMVYNGAQYKVNLRYMSIDGKFIDFKSGIEGCAYVMPEVISNGNGGLGKNPIGAIMFLSPRLMRGYFAQKYILNDPFNKFPNFVVAHKEPSLIGTMLNNQGMTLPDFFYFGNAGGVQGPITIWKINYTGKEKVIPAYIDTDASKYLSWQL